MSASEKLWGGHRETTWGPSHSGTHCCRLFPGPECLSQGSLLRQPELCAPGGRPRLGRSALACCWWGWPLHFPAVCALSAWPLLTPCVPDLTPFPPVLCILFSRDSPMWPTALPRVSFSICFCYFLAQHSLRLLLPCSSVTGICFF